MSRKALVALITCVSAALVAGGAIAQTVADPDYSTPADRELERKVAKQGPLTSSGDPGIDADVRRAETPQSIAPVARTDSVEGTAADPAAGHLRWIARVYRSRSGQKCSQVGQEKAGKFGKVFEERRFVEHKLGYGGSCATRGALNEVPYFGLMISQREVSPRRTVLSGMVGPKVARIVVGEPGGARELPISKRGAFLAIYAGDVNPASYPVTAVLRDGSEQTLRLQGLPDATEDPHASR